MSHIDSGIRKILNSNFVYRTYQSLVKKSGSDIYYVKKYIKPFDNCRILDIGCGPGTFLEYYNHTIDYEGFDMNKDYIEYAQKKYGTRGRFYCKPVDDKLVLENRKYDIITCNALLHHLSNDEAKALFKVASSLLHPNGRLVTLDPIYVEKQNMISYLMIKYDRGQSIRTIEEYKVLSEPYFSKIESGFENDFYIFPFDLVINVFKV